MTCFLMKSAGGMEGRLRGKRIPHLNALNPGVSQLNNRGQIIIPNIFQSGLRGTIDTGVLNSGVIGQWHRDPAACFPRSTPWEHEIIERPKLN